MLYIEAMGRIGFRGKRLDAIPFAGKSTVDVCFLATSVVASIRFVHHFLKELMPNVLLAQRRFPRRIAFVRDDGLASLERTRWLRSSTVKTAAFGSSVDVLRGLVLYSASRLDFCRLPGQIVLVQLR